MKWNKKPKQKQKEKKSSKHVLSHELNKNEFQGQIFQSSTLKTVCVRECFFCAHSHAYTNIFK